jgi:hypothetical protein
MPCLNQIQTGMRGIAVIHMCAPLVDSKSSLMQVRELDQTSLIVTVAQIGATERAIEWATVEVSCEYRLSHGYDIISLGRSTICMHDVIMTSLEHSGTV